MPVVVMEAGVPQGREAIAGPGGALVCLERFGASGRRPAVQASLGFDADNVADTVLGVLRAPEEEGVGKT